MKWPTRAAALVAVLLVLGAFTSAFTLVGCEGSDGAGSDRELSGRPDVLADTGFLADIAQNVAGDLFTVSSLVPAGADPHSFEPTPQDAVRVVEAQAVVINVTGLMPTVDELIAGRTDGDLLVIEAAAGLADGSDDPHFWLDPLSVITYAENIAAGFSDLDPEGAAAYEANAEAYAARLRELDAWIRTQVESIPVGRRLLVTNHESFGHFAARYGFEVIGTIFPSTSGEGSPSARQLSELVESIVATGAPAIFLETGSNPQLAEQVARETGVAVVTELCTHSLGEHASTYLDMMRWNVDLIVEALQ